MISVHSRIQRVISSALIASSAGSTGIDALGTIWLILFAHVFYNVSIVIRLVSGVWANLDPRAEEAAR